MCARLKKSLGLIIFFLLGGVANARYIGVRVGVDCRIYIRDFGSEPFLIDIGSRVTIASGVRLITHDGSGWLVRDEKGRRYRYGKIVIEDNVFIGVNAIILPGVVIGRNSIIAAGAVVSKDVQAGSVMAGVPARVVDTFENWQNRALKDWPSDQEKIDGKNYQYIVEKMLHDQKR